jgi:peptidoglycan/LPS O-acetylase OafA/YrhL
MKRAVNPKHVLGIDALRFFAAMLVLFFHYLYLTGVQPDSYPGWASGRLVVFPEAYAWSHFGWVGVQIFFVVSGFVIAFSAEKASPFSFFSSRVVRLAPGTWICASVALAVTLTLTRGVNVHDTLMSFLNTILFRPFGPWMDGTYWTLAIEIAFYAMVWVLIALRRFAWIRHLAIAIGLASSGFWLAVTLVGPADASWIGGILDRIRASRKFDLVLVHHGMFFALGVFLWLQLVVRATRANWLWMGLFVAGGCLQIAAQSDAYNRQFGVFYSPATPLAIWLGALVFVVVSVRYNALLHRTPQALLRGLRMAGLMTFPLYLLHELSGAAVMGWAAASGLPAWPAFAVAVAAVLAASFAVAAYVEPSLQAATRVLLERARRLWNGVAAAFAR